VLMKRCTAPNAQVATASMQRDYLPSIDPVRHGAHGERRAQLAAVAFGPTECAMLQRGLADFAPWPRSRQRRRNRSVVRVMVIVIVMTIVVVIAVSAI